MLLPWYVTGAARPESAKYEGYKKDVKKTQSLVDAVRRANQSAPPPAAAPAWSPAPAARTPAPVALTSPSAPQPVQQTYQPLPQMSMAPVATQPQMSMVPATVLNPEQAEAEQPAGYQPPDPLGWYPGGSEGFWARIRTVPQIPGALWDAGAGLGIDLSTPGTESRGKEKAAEQAERRQAANDLIQGVVDRKQADETIERGTEKDRKENVVQITLDEWNAMSPAQQNAVRFNTDLVAAVERDRANQKQYDPSMTEKAAYDAVLMDVFGTTASSAPGGLEYAPETVGVLKNLDLIPAQDLGTLDDFLKLDVAITAKQVEQIERQLQPTGPEHLVGRNELTPAEERLQRAQALTRAQGQISSRLEGELERGRRLISDMSAEANTAAAAELGAIVQNEQDVMGSLAENEATVVNSVTRYLADPRNDISGESADSVMQGIAEFDAGLDENSQKRIYAAIVEAARRGATGGSWFDQEADAGIKWRTPQQVAGALGLPMQKVG